MAGRVIIYGFNLNISPKMSYAVLECDVVVTESPVYDFVIKKRGCYLCQTLYIPVFFDILNFLHLMFLII